MLRQEMTWYDQEGIAVLLARMSHEVPMLKSLVGSNIASAASAGGTSLLGLIFAAYYSWRFTLCILLALPLIAIGPLAIMLNWRKCEGDFSGGVVSESINSIKSVAAFALEDRQMIKYEKLLQEHMKGERAIRIASGFGTGISAAGVFLTMAMAVFAVNYLVSAGLMHPDQATFVLFTLMTCITSFGEFARWFADSRLPQESARRIFEIIDRVSLIDSMSEDGLKPLEVAGCIEFQDVVFSYSTRPNVTVLDGFTLTIKPNTTVALVGPSGCGKSTTISLLQRFYDPHKGMVRLDSRDIRDLNIGWMRAQMSLVQQEPVLFSCSVLENLRYGCPDASMDTVLAAARSANANDFILTLPKQYDTQVGHRGTELSGGQKQRIAIARALIRDPAILLLDEATSALDAGSEHLVQLALDTLLKAKRRTTIIVAHRLSTIRSADQICVIREGKVAELGSHDDLCAVSGGHYARFLAKQEITV
jgi:ATP-binding cassette, subfamily B (MDR/TAP), member 1